MAARKITGKQILAGSGAVVLAGGVIYFSRLSRMKANLEILSKVIIQKINLTGITIRVEVQIKNPTEGSVKVKFPFIKMQYKGSTFASSEVQNKDFTLPKFGQINLDPIFITLSYMNLATTAPALLRDYRTTGNLSFNLETITTLNNSIPFSKVSLIKL